MIVKNEEHFLGRCLESARDVVDEMVIVDTGSTDRTVEIAERYGARVYDHPWQDSFSEARNFGLQFAQGDWLLQLDADEELEREDVPLIREYVRSTEYDGYSVVFLNYGPENAVYRHRNVRLFRRGCVHYEGIVHNVPVVSGKVFLSPVRIHHHGYNISSDGLMKKFKRSEALLLRQIREEPENGYARANLVRNLRLQRAFKESIVEAEKALSLLRLSISDRQMVLNDLLYGYFITGDLRKAEEIGRCGLRENPYHLDMLFVMGSVMVRQRKFEEAVAYFSEYLRVRESGEELPGLEGLLTDTYGYEGRVWNNIGSCFLELGKVDKAVDAYQKAIGYERTNVLFYKNLASVYLQEGGVKSAVDVLEDALRMGVADDVVKRSLERLKSWQRPVSVV